MKCPPGSVATLSEIHGEINIKLRPTKPGGADSDTVVMATREERVEICRRGRAALH